MRLVAGKVPMFESRRLNISDTDFAYPGRMSSSTRMYPPLTRAELRESYAESPMPAVRTLL